MVSTSRLAIGLVAAGLLAAGCSGAETRSVENYCTTYEAEKKAYLDKYAELSRTANEQEDPLLAVVISAGAGIASIGDARAIFDKLADVAPQEIQPDVETVRDSLQQSIDDAGEALDNPLSGLGKALLNGLTSAGSWDRVGAWTEENCGA
jgi:hypothetical protein